MYKDKEQQKEYQRNWFQRNKARTQVSRAKCKKENKANLAKWFHGYKSNLCCVRCGESHPACLHFHHIDPKQKRFSISSGFWQGVCRSELMREIAKCLVLCANCHAKHHASTVTMPTLGM